MSFRSYPEAKDTQLATIRAGRKTMPFVTNLGRYNEGCLDGAFLKLPATTEDVQALLKRIHVDGVRHTDGI